MTKTRNKKKDFENKQYMSLGLERKILQSWLIIHTNICTQNVTQLRLELILYFGIQDFWICDFRFPQF